MRNGPSEDRHMCPGVPLYWQSINHNMYQMYDVNRNKPTYLLILGDSMPVFIKTWSRPKRLLILKFYQCSYEPQCQAWDRQRAGSFLSVCVCISCRMHTWNFNNTCPPLHSHSHSPKISYMFPMLYIMNATGDKKSVIWCMPQEIREILFCTC